MLLKIQSLPFQSDLGIFANPIKLVNFNIRNDFRNSLSNNFNRNQTCSFFKSAVDFDVLIIARRTPVVDDDLVQSISD